MQRTSEVFKHPEKADAYNYSRVKQVRHMSKETRKQSRSLTLRIEWVRGCFNCTHPTKYLRQLSHTHVPAKTKLLTMAQRWHIIYRHTDVQKTTVLCRTNCVWPLWKHSDTIIFPQYNQALHLSTYSNSSSLHKTFDWSYSTGKMRNNKKKTSHTKKLQSQAP